MKITLTAILALAAPAFAQEFELEDPENPVALIKTSMGDVYVELFAKEAPKTVENFLGLAEGTKEYKNLMTGEMTKGNFYDGLIFHRVIKGFMIQGGCPKGTGMGGPGYAFEDEINADALGLDKIKAHNEQGAPHNYLLIRDQMGYQRTIAGPFLRKLGITTQEQLTERMEEVKKKVLELTLKEVYENLGYKFNDKLKSHHPKKGVIAMANSGPNTNGSQFFINLDYTPHLTGKHTVFGRVVKGMDVVEKIGEVKVSPMSKPEEDVKITSIRRHTGEKKEE